MMIHAKYTNLEKREDMKIIEDKRFKKGEKDDKDDKHKYTKKMLEKGR